MKRRLLAVVLLLVAGTATGADVSMPADPRVRMDDGVVSGRYSDDGAVAAFLGIPFAEAPVGDRRWRAPEPFHLGGALEATSYAPACMQSNYLVSWYRDLIGQFGGDPAGFPEPDFDEDCLYLNIWTPAVDARADLPVMVWIHGGNHRGGWPYEPDYRGERLARQGVVVISIAYRVDLFGFFSHPDLAIANFGLLDQAAALGWVQAHIRPFGGDPGNVTVFGESAGAASIGYLLAMPAAASHFSRAIHESAGYEATTLDRREDFTASGRAIEAAVLGSGGRGIDALRDVSAGKLLEAAHAVYGDAQPGVVIDRITVREAFADALAAGRVAGKDLLIGTNADEWRMYLDENTDVEVVRRQAEKYGPSNTDAIRRALGTADTPIRQLDRLITAHEFVCPSLAIAGYMRSQGKRAYTYYFSRVRPSREAEALGAYHGAELPYVFDTHAAWLPADATDRVLTGQVMAYWTSFARNGIPLGPGDAPAWPPYDATNAGTLVLGDDLHVAAHPETALCTALGEAGRGAAR